MRHRGRIVAVALLLVTAVVVAVGARVLAQRGEGWYDAEPLARSLRPELREEAAREAGVERLDELPLYDLELAVHEGLGRFDLDEEVWITNRWGAPLDHVVLRIHANTTSPDDPPVRLKGGECEPIACEVASDLPSVIVVTLESALGEGQRLRVRLSLEGELPRIDSFRSSMLGQAVEGVGRLGGDGGGPGAGYGMLGRGDSIASFAQFYAVLAPRRDGRWQRGAATPVDESAMGDLGPTALSHVRLAVSVPDTARVVTSGVRLGQRALPKQSRREVRAAAGLVRNFALLVSDDFVVSEREVRGVKVRSWFLPGSRGAGEQVLDTAAGALALFDRRFGRYPFAELDVVQAPLVGGAGGVEYSGLVTVASMLYDGAERPQKGPLGQLGRMLGAASAGGPATDTMREFVTAHEVAHQWWHGLVGSDARRQPWMDESLAQYSAVLYVEHAHGAARAEREMQRQVIANYHLMRLMGGPDGAVNRPVGDFDGDLEYAGLVYGKGAVMFRALREELGDRAFFAGLRRYVERNAFGTASGRGPVDALATGPKANEVRAIATRWLEQRHGDDDLGEPDAAALLSGWTDSDLAEQMGPLMEQILPALGGGGPGAGGSGQAPSRRQLQQSVEQLRRLLDEM